MNTKYVYFPSSRIPPDFDSLMRRDGFEHSITLMQKGSFIPGFRLVILTSREIERVCESFGIRRNCVSLSENWTVPATPE